MRMGVVTGQGLADLIREQFGVRWTALVMLALLVANTGVIISEFVGISQASELLGHPAIHHHPADRRADLVAGCKGLAKEGRTGISGHVARLFLLRDLRISRKTGLAGGRGRFCEARASVLRRDIFLRSWR